MAQLGRLSESSERRWTIERPFVGGPIVANDHVDERVIADLQGLEHSDQAA